MSGTDLREFDGDAGLGAGRHRLPALAQWLLGLGIAATLAANVAHGLRYGPVGAVVVGWDGRDWPTPGASGPVLAGVGVPVGDVPDGGPRDSGWPG